MEIYRLLLFIALAFVMLLIWQAWQEDYGRPAAPPVAGQQQETPGPPETAEVPTVEQAPQAAAPPEAPALTNVLNSAGRIRVQTDVLDVEIDTLGGDLRQAYLREYPVSEQRPDVPFRLLSDQPPRLFVAQSGFAARSGEAGDAIVAAPNHTSLFTAEKDAYALAPGADELTVDLYWTSPEGVQITKRYVFHRGSYLVNVQHRVTNQATRPWRGALYQQLQRTPEESTSRFLYTYTGGVYWGPEAKYTKVAFDDMEEAPLARQITGGWAAMIQHYFLAAWIPPAEQPFHYYTRALGGERYVIGMYSPEREVAPGATEVFQNQLYAGPKLQEVLEDIAPGLELTVDYGMLTVLAKPLFWLLEVIHDLVGNWGWAIVILTILIKAAFYKLSETSYKSMANMRRIQPRLMALKERYGNDRQRMNQALMDMYRKEKINPLGGCLPILVQIPVFIALYWVLLESVELRQADWILWINDLSTKDPYYVLPLLMGVTMFAQQKLNPAPLDPIQAKVMMILPVVFTVFFAFFPAGLVLYWLVNNALSILQQWYITRVVLSGS